MTSDDQNDTARVDRASRVILSTPRTLFRAFVDREMLASWRAPDGMSARIEQFDPRIGGGYRMILRYQDQGLSGKSGDGSDIVKVRFLELSESQIVEAISFVSDDPAYAMPMTLATRFEPLADGTKVTMSASDVPLDIDPQDHKVGMASSLRQLALLTE